MEDLKPGPGLSSSAPKTSGNSDAADPDATVNPDLRISGAQSSPRSESDIRVNYFDPTKILSASNNISSGGAQAINYSTDSGANWGHTTLPLISPDGAHSDPTVEWTSDSRAWSSTLGINGSQLKLRNYFSLDNGATWTSKPLHLPHRSPWTSKWFGSITAIRRPIKTRCMRSGTTAIPAS